ncbi:hypothetical protein [Terasakiella pusilla]|nr:hypothetical protein [Terasakiella pusilla]
MTREIHYVLVVTNKNYSAYLSQALVAANDNREPTKQPPSAAALAA